jgi:tetratricopeptide (TPR) repeat protein/serine/threonine protein kinase
MTNWDPQANDLFLHAVQLRSLGERRDYLDRACAGDAALRAEVDALLEASARAGSFLEAPAPGFPSPSGGDGQAVRGIATVDESPGERPGTVIGPYKLLQQIGEGGMGTVFMAEQTQPVQRKVALKLIKSGMDSRQILARFEAERQALALMDHPNIAKVLDAGTAGSWQPAVGSKNAPASSASDEASLLPAAHCPLPATGRPYFVMELVKGVPLTQYCDERRLTPRERLELFVPVCQAVQHAHQKGVIHRDLKPSNVLVAQYDSKPVPKVIDFGVAKATGPKLTQRTLFTEFGALVGTLEYMSPEQAELNQLDIDTRSDIYALGVLLYELLTGTTPLGQNRIKDAGLLEALRIIREEETPRPSARLSTTKELARIAANRGLEPRKLSGLVRGELDWIVMKCLEKDRNRRYESADGLARDIERYLHDEPVQACPPSAGYRLRKFARRNKVGLGIAGLVLLFLLLLGGGGGWMVRDQAVRQATLEKEVNGALDDVATAYQRDNPAEAMAALKRAEALLAGGGGSVAWQQRVGQWRRDLEMIGRLDDILLEQFEDKAEPYQTGDAAHAYQEAFQAYGLDPQALDPDEAAQRIRASAIKQRLVAALDGWRVMLWQDRLPGWQPLLALSRQADDDPWRDRFRQIFDRLGPTSAARNATAVALLGSALGQGPLLAAATAVPARPAEAIELEKLARDKEVLAQPSTTVFLLALMLAVTEQRTEAIELLQQAHRRHPGDFWINAYLGDLLTKVRPARRDQAVSHYRAALAVRPESRAMHINLGSALMRDKKLTEAESEFRELLRQHPDYAKARVNLAIVRRKQGKHAEEIAELLEAIRRNPNDEGAHHELSTSRFEEGKYAEAEAELRLALGLKPNNAQALSNLGVVLLQRGEVAKSEAACQEALRLAPRLAGVHANLAIVLVKNGKLAEAEQEYLQAIALEPEDFVAHNGLGALLFKRGKLAEAEAALREAVRLAEPNYAICHSNLAGFLQKWGKPVEAVAACRQALRIKPESARAHNTLGLALGDLGQLAEAEAEFHQAIRLLRHPPKVPRNTIGITLHQWQWGEADVHENLGSVLHRQGKWAQAAAAYRKAIGLKPSASAHHNLGAALQKQGQVAEAAAAYHKAIRLDPSAESYNNLAELHVLKPDYDAAIAACRQAIRLKPKWAEPSVTLGFALSKKGLHDEAIAVYRDAIRVQTESVKLYRNLAASLFMKGLLDETVKAYQEVLRLDPADAESHFWLGVTLDRQGKVSEAEPEYRAAIRLKSDYADAHFNLGMALHGQGKHADAAAAFHKAAVLKPDYAEAHASLGDALRVQGKLAEAETAYRNAIRISPAHARAHQHLANILLQLGKLAEVEHEYRQAVRHQPNWALAHNTLGAYLCDHKHDYDGAAAAFREAIRLDPGYAPAHYNLGSALDRKGKNAEAAAAYREAIRLKPDYPMAHYYLGTVLNRAGNREGAMAAFRRAIVLNPSNVNAYLSLGVVLMDTSDVEGGIAVYKQAVAVNPGFAGAYYRLGNALLKKSDHEKAIAAYRKAIALDGRDAQAHCNLGHALSAQGKFTAALAAMKKGHELGLATPKWSYPSADWLADCERLAALEARLPAILRGQAKAKGWQEHFDFADVCDRKGLTVAAARLYYEGLSIQPVRTGFLFNAARAATRAACGQGKGAAALDENECTRWRKQALEWLRADMELRREQLQSDKPKAREAVQRTLQVWEGDADLAGLRDAVALARLPRVERESWQTFWVDVEELVQKAKTNKRP